MHLTQAKINTVESSESFLKSALSEGGNSRLAGTDVCQAYSNPIDSTSDHHVKALEVFKMVHIVTITCLCISSTCL